MIHLNRHTHTEHSNTVNAVEVHQTADNQPHGVGLTEIHTANYHISNPDQYIPDIISQENLCFVCGKMVSTVDPLEQHH